MAQRIMVTPELLESTASEIEGLANEYKAQYNELYTTTGNLASTWSGADNVAFINQIEGFKDDLENMYRRSVAPATAGSTCCSRPVATSTSSS